MASREVGMPECKESKLAKMPPEGSTEIILLVEDLPSLRKVICRNLERGGYTVICAADSVEALKIASSHKEAIHLLLTDVIMPKMGGLQLARLVAKLQPRIGVLYMSGLANEMLNESAESDVAFIRKPFEMSTLMAKVQEEMERRCLR
jgi:CheY-like chemotaxis protein